MNAASIRDGFASLRQGCWAALVAGLSAVFSFALACATPFAALVTVAVSLLRIRILSEPLMLAAGFAVAFAVYEFVLFSATSILPSGDEAFSLHVVLQILWPNMLALAGLAALHRLALSVGFLPRPEAGRTGACGRA